MSDRPINGLLITGLLAILGTVTGGVVKGFWDTQLAENKFQSELILRALEPDDTKERIASLNFLVSANLISDPEIRQGLKALIEKGGDSIPQFTRSRSQSAQLGARNDLNQIFPELEGKNVALIGFKVRHGDIIDAVTPIYAGVSPQLELVGEFEGKKIGGDGGDETRIVKQGHVITQINVQRGDYFGGVRVIHFQVTWAPIGAKGLNSSASILSERLGGGDNTENLQAVEIYKAEDGGFVSDFTANSAYHTSDDVFLSDFKVQETMVLSTQ